MAWLCHATSCDAAWRHMTQRALPAAHTPSWVCCCATAPVCLCVARCMMQREAREKVRELSKRIGASNALRLAASPTAKPRPKEPSARQRAAEYAKASVPKPELLKQRTSSTCKRGSSAPAAVASSSGSGGGGQVGRACDQTSRSAAVSPGCALSG